MHSAAMLYLAALLTLLLSTPASPWFLQSLLGRLQQDTTLPPPARQLEQDSAQRGGSRSCWTEPLDGQIYRVCQVSSVFKIYLKSLSEKTSSKSTFSTN